VPAPQPYPTCSSKTRPSTEISPAPVVKPRVTKDLCAKAILTVAGPVQFLRPCYVCAHSHHAPNPSDDALGIEHREFSPGVRRMMAVAGERLAL